MLYLRPQRVYKPSAASQYNSDDYLAHLLDQMDESLYRLRLETPRGTSITEDNSQITCYAHIFDKRDGTELTDLLKGRGWRPTWLLDDKPIDSARISEEGYLLTLETTHLPAIYQTVTLQARDTDILLALTDETQDKAWLQRVIASGDIPTHLLQASEKLLDIHYLDKLRIDGIEIVKQDLSKEIAANTTALEELNKHPLTVSQDGYWRIWDAIKKTYVTTEYQSRGEKGEQGEKGDKGERGERGYRGYQGEAGATGEKGPKGDKGDKPNIHWDGTKLIIDNMAPVDLQGQRGEAGQAGAKGEAGHSPEIHIGEDDYLYVDGIKQRYVKGAKGEQGEAGHSPSPKDVLDTDLFKQRLSGEVTMQVTPVANKADASLDQLKDVRSQITRVSSGLSGTATDVSKMKTWSKQTDSIISSLASKTNSSSGDITNIKDTLAKSNQYIDTAFEYLQNISNQTNSSRSYSISTSGYITSHSRTCAFVEKDTSPGLGSCMPPKEEPPIRVTLRSDFDQLKQQVDILTARLAQLQSANTITPLTDNRLRKYGDTLYPKYGDWLLTSDASTQSLSFSGLNAEVGKSIYIQTRKKVYLFANGHSFFGLPGSSTSENQWLSNNTTYRFVRANATAWLVTASSSPYPWT